MSLLLKNTWTIQAVGVAVLCAGLISLKNPAEAQAEPPAKSPTDVPTEPSVESSADVAAEPSEDTQRIDEPDYIETVDPKKTVLIEKVETATIEFTDEWDWIRLTSGEWLKGSIERMRDDKLEFDSDELDLLQIDWADIAEVRSPTTNTYVTVDRHHVSGPAMIDDKTITVETKSGVKAFPRENLMSIIEGDARERNYWSTKLGVGLSASKGNSDQITWNANWSLLREDSLTRSELLYDGTFGTVSGEESVNRHLGTVDTSIYLSKLFYVKPVFGQLLYDKFQNIRLRATPGAGGGITMIDKPAGQWDFEVGAGYQYLSYISPGTGIDDPQNDALLIFRTYADIDITGDIELILDWRTNLVVTTIGNTNHVGSAALTIEVTDIFDFDVSFLYLRTEDPDPREDGTIPEKNDYQLVVGVALEIG